MSDIGGGLDGRLAEGTHMNGTLEFERAVQIDGRFEGSVKSPGKLILGATAEVDADIAVGELEVQGNLRGKIEAKKRLVIRNGGSIEGNINTGQLAIENGAVFRGSCDMPEPGKPVAAAPPPKPEGGEAAKDPAAKGLGPEKTEEKKAPSSSEVKKP